MGRALAIFLCVRLSKSKATICSEPLGTRSRRRWRLTLSGMAPSAVKPDGPAPHPAQWAHVPSGLGLSIVYPHTLSCVYLVHEKSQGGKTTSEHQSSSYFPLTLCPQGVISIPSPCQYAHKLTFLVAQSIHKEPSLALANSLFYL